MRICKLGQKTGTKKWVICASAAGGLMLAGGACLLCLNSKKMAIRRRLCFAARIMETAGDVLRSAGGSVKRVF